MARPARSATGPGCRAGQAGRDYALVQGRGPCAGQFTLGGSKPIWVYWQATACRPLSTIHPAAVLRAATTLLTRRAAESG